MRVRDEEVQAQVQPGPDVVEAVGAQVEQRPRRGVAHLVRHLLADPFQLVRRVRPAAQVGVGEDVGRDVGQDLLQAVGAYDEPEGLMPFDQGAQGALEPCGVEVVDVEFQVGVGGDAAQGEGAVPAEPVRLLDVGQRERFVAGGGVEGDRLLGVRSGGRGQFGDGGGEAAQRPRVEEPGDRYPYAQFGLDPGGQGDRHQRGAAQGEEARVRVGLLHAEGFAPQGAEPVGDRGGGVGAGRRGWWCGGLGAVGVPPGYEPLECGPVDLAVGREGQAFQRQQGGRDHVAGQVGGEGLPQGGRLERPAGRGDGEADEAPLAPGFTDRDHRAGRDVVEPFQGGLDLAQFDAVAADLDLVVLPAEEFEGAVGEMAGVVAGAVEAPPGGGVGREAPRGLFGVAPVAAGDSGAADVELAGDPVGPGAQVLVEHGEALVGQGGAVRNAAPAGVHPADLVPDRPDRALGGAAEAHDRRPVGGQGADPVGQAEGDPVAAEHHRAQGAQRVGGEGLGVLGEDGAQGGDGVPQGDAFASYEVGPVAGVAAAGVGGDDQGAAGGEHAEQVVDGEVEAQGGDGEDGVVGAGGEAPVDAFQGVGRAEVVDHDALGFARGARGEDGVGEVGEGLDRLQWSGAVVECGVVVHGEHGDAGRDGQFVQQGPLCEDDGALAAPREVDEALGGQFGVQRQERRSRLQHAQRGHRLLPALAGDDGDQLVRPGAEAPQGVADAPGAAGQLAVGQAGVAGDHGGRLGPAPCGVRDRLVQQAGGQRCRGGADAVADGRLGGGQRGPAGFLPGARICGEPGQRCGVGVEHGVQDAGGEQFLDGVPVEDQLAAVLGDLVVEVDLGRLADAEDGLPQRPWPVLAVRPVGGGVADRQVGGEDDGGQQPGRGVAVQCPFPHHGAPADGGVVEVLPEAALEPPRPVGEVAGQAVVDLQQAQRGEVADDPPDVGVHRAAVEDGQHQRVPRASAPGGDDLGERGQQHPGGAEPGGAGAFLDYRPGRGVEPPGPALEVRCADALGRGGQGQLRSGRQCGQPPPPVGQRLLVPRRGAEPLLVQYVVAEAGRLRGELPCGVGVARREFGHDEAEAVGVADERVHADVHHGRGGGDGDPDVEQRPAVGGHHLVGHLLAQRRPPVALSGLVRLPQVVHRHLVGGYFGQYLLEAVGADHRAQHRVPVDHAPQGAGEPLQVEPWRLDLQVGVGGDAAEREAALAADVVGPLDVGEGERLVPGAGVGGEGRALPGVEGGAARDAVRERGDGGGGEDVPQADVHAAAAAQFGGDPRGEEGVPAEQEEVVVRAGWPVQGQRVGEDAGDRGLGGGARRDPGGAGGRGVGLGQPPVVGLAVRGRRQLVQHGDRRGDEGGGQGGAQEAGQLGRRGRGGPGLRLNVGPQAGGVRVRRHGGGPHRGVGQQGPFDLAGLGPVPADLYLAVGAAQQFQVAVGPLPGHVARAEHAFAAGAVRVGQERGGGGGGAVVVAAGQARAADEEFAGHRRGQRAQPGVADQRARSGDGRPDRGARGQRGPVGAVGVDAGGGGVAGDLAGAVEVEQGAAGQAGVEAVGQVGVEGLAAGDPGPQARQPGVERGVPGVLGQQHGEQRGHGHDAADVLFLQCAHEEGGVAGGVRGQDEEGDAGQQGAEEFPDRVDEAGGGACHGHVAGDEGVGGAHPGDAVHGAAVRAEDAFGFAGRSGGVEEVGEVVGVDGEAEVVPGVPGDGGGLVAQGGGGEDGRGAGVGEDRGEPFARVARVERHVGGAGLEDGEGGGHGVGAGRQVERHPVLGPHPAGPQVPGQPVGARVEGAVGDAVVAVDDGHRVGGLRRLRFEQLVESRGGRGGGGG